MTSEDLNDVWIPNAVFLRVVDTKSIIPYGKDDGTFDCWIILEDGVARINFYQALMVTTTCNYEFSDFPFDEHECHIDFGLPQYTFNDRVMFNPIKILTETTKAEIVEKLLNVPNEHLPFDFSLSTKDQFPYYNYDYMAVYTGLKLKLERNGLGSLVGSFYAPTAVFSSLSLISFFIKPDVVRYWYKSHLII